MADNKLSIKQRIFNYIEKFLFTKKLKDAYIYENKEHDILLFLDVELKVMNVYVKGVVYKLPIVDLKKLSSSSEHDQEYQDYNTDLESLTIPQIQSLLNQYEKDENYEECKRIKDFLEKNSNNEKTN
jgi:hypothetical protein